jgi:hypothetical protein
LCRSFTKCSEFVAELLASEHSEFGLQLQAEREIFDKWRILYYPFLSWACFNAFDLRRHPERGKTHVFCVTLEARERRRRKPSNAYRVSESILMDRADFQEHRTGFNLLLSQEREHAKRADKRVVSPMCIKTKYECIVTYLCWFDREILALNEDSNWESVLRRAVDGKNEYEIVQANPVRRKAAGAFVPLVLHRIPESD